jgi:hypothetical protein
MDAVKNWQWPNSVLDLPVTLEAAAAIPVTLCLLLPALPGLRIRSHKRRWKSPFLVCPVSFL